MKALYNLSRRLSNTIGKRLIRTISYNISSNMRYLQRNLIYKNAKKSGNGAAISTAAAATGAPGAGFLPSGFSSY